MVQLRIRPMVSIALLVLGAFVANLTVGAANSRADVADMSTTSGQPLVIPQVLNVNCPFSFVAFTTSYTKVLDVGTFTVQATGSIVEATFNGRIYVGSFIGGSTGARFELRVDDLPTTNGRARATVRAAEAGGFGVPVSIAGMFTGLSAGSHTISIWVQGAFAGGSDAGVDPGCWSSDHIVIKEYIPFGVSYMPAILK